MRQGENAHGEIVKRGWESHLPVQSIQKRELFWKFPFLRFKLSTLCRQLERTVSRISDADTVLFVSYMLSGAVTPRRFSAFFRVITVA